MVNQLHEAVPLTKNFARLNDDTQLFQNAIKLLMFHRVWALWIWTDITLEWDKCNLNLIVQRTPLQDAKYPSIHHFDNTHKIYQCSQYRKKKKNIDGKCLHNNILIY